MKEERKSLKGGRPGKGDDARSHTVSVMVSANDLKEIMDIKKLTKRSKSDIIYNRYKNNKFNIIDKSVFSTEHLRMFQIANNNLNQIAKQVNTHKQHNLYKDQIEVLKLVADTLIKIQP